MKIVWKQILHPSKSIGHEKNVNHANLMSENNYFHQLYAEKKSHMLVNERKITNLVNLLFGEEERKKILSSGCRGKKNRKFTYSCWEKILSVV